ncbi:TonB-dependent receptor [Spongiivirga citrea]|uniref:TonB-dependent receptor n=1 Tax=Spongiivirga citrea TaxID=1481457 RepID=A0A6M0CM35_9FLAO|nr:TonB-dependent receptor [Spongiivirga citrea]NER18998.1 TonB-dependent receptor [Spongiivirga citrea]
MKIKLITLMLFVTSFALAQTGGIAGKITDKDMNNDPLPFATVVIKGTTKGAQTDFDGLFTIEGLEPGTYTVVVSFVGYETLEVPNVVVEAGKVTEVNTGIGSSAVSLDEVILSAPVARKDSQVALLLEQKKAVQIKESIGAKQLAKVGVSDAASATTKISGVASSEGSGDVFVRGLGDRYLATTLNGLPIPSDDVDKKNIDLSLFPTKVIQNVGISKTFAVESSADQASGNVDIVSRTLAGQSELSASVSSGINTNVAQNGVYDNFKVSPNLNDANFGFYKQQRPILQQITQQSWNTVNQDNPINYSASVTAGYRLKEKLSLLLTASHSQSYEYRKGLFRQFRSNFIDDTITDATTYNKKITNTLLGDATYFINDRNKLKYTFFFINKLNDEVFEGGRNGEATIFEETNPAEGLFQFIRDQNTKQTNVVVNQLLGTHRLSEKNTLEWAGSFNFLEADEPNRIRNEVNFDPNGTLVQLGRNGGFQQRKSSQKIEDVEYNARIKDIFNVIEEENNTFKIEVGGAYRNKAREFSSEFVGVEETSTNAINPTSIDDLGAIFQLPNFQNELLEINLLGLNARGRRRDIYDGELESKAIFTNVNVGFGKWNFNGGLRWQEDDINVTYDIGNLFPRVGESIQNYNNVYPTFSTKYSLNEKHAFRFAVSRTITLPEFKEVSPFEYVSPTGQVTRGNVDVQASTDLNYDLKWEYFPSAGQLVSLAAFYKDIKDPINRVRDRGSAGVFSYFNSAEKAEVFGLEAETKIDLISPNQDEEGNNTGYGLNMVFNATRMWHTQDLKDVTDEDGTLLRTFKYGDNTETDLQGASDWIFNTSLNFNTEGENPFAASLSANFASDKIFALGVPTDQANRVAFYDDSIVEKGFVVLDAVISKEFGKHWKATFTGKNLLNPTVKQVQSILQNPGEVLANPDSAQRITRDETVLSYTNGVGISLGLSYKF